MTFPSGVVIHNFAKLIGISDLAAASTGIGNKTNTREWIITTLILNIQHIFNL